LIKDFQLRKVIQICLDIYNDGKVGGDNDDDDDDDYDGHEYDDDNGHEY